MVDLKPRLSDFVRKALLDQHLSIPRAADKIGLPYERLKKALLRNRFSDEDLKLLLPGRMAEELREEYSFDHSRPYARAKDIEKRGSEELSLMDALSGPFQLLQRAADATDFEFFVTDLYAKKLDKNYSMVLFCHDGAEPIEWHGGNRSVLLKVANALVNGARIIYVMELDLANMVIPEPQERDLIDRRFEKYLDSLREACAEIQEEPPSGMIALLRVPRCSFCIPYQKPTLFTKLSNDQMNAHYALTTVELPYMPDGRGERGILVLPQRSEVAAHMTEYLRELIRHIKHTGDNKALFHFNSEPRLDNGNIIEQLEKIVQ